MSKFTIEDFKGVSPASITNFNKDEEIDEKIIKNFYRYLLKFDIGGLYITGSTGETFLMTPDERKKVLEIIMDEVKDEVPVVAHIGAMSTKISIELAKHAEAHGVTAISSVPPFYWKFNDDQIFNYYKDIAQSVNIPLIIYNVPLIGMMPVDMIKRLSEIENVNGVKYTGTDIFEITMIKDTLGEDFLVYGGADELASSNLAIGVDGIIGSFYNMIPDVFIEIYDLTKKGEYAKAARMQKNALRIIMYTLKFGSMAAAIKAILRQSGVEAGYSRRPFNNFSDEKEKEIARGLIDLAYKYNCEDIAVVKRLIERL